MDFSDPQETRTGAAVRRLSGGQSKFSPARAASIVTAIEGGAFAGSAAESVGVSRWTLNRWRQRGERELARASEFVDYPDLLVADVVDEVESAGGGALDAFSAPCVPPFEESEWPFVLLMHLLKRTQARAANRAVQSILAAGRQGKWQASAWWLERAHPTDYGRHRTYVQGSNAEARDAWEPQAAHEVTSEELLERLRELKSARNGY